MHYQIGVTGVLNWHETYTLL